VTPYDGANVLLVESDLVHVVRQRGYIAKEDEKAWLNQRIPVAKLAVLQQLMDIGKPMAIANTNTSAMWIGFPDLDWVNSNVIAPIQSNHEILGFLSLDSATPGFFTQAHADQLQTFADQAAIAIQNARLLDRAKRAAVLGERNRIANELHDTISQTLWSMSLITERLPVIWEIDQVTARGSLATLHQLSQNALEEMRSLLLELHPLSLTNAKLGDLITQVSNIMTSRTGIAIQVQIIAQVVVPPAVHFTIYRVVQEALNNVALHALANHVDVTLNSTAQQLELTIQDNGRGFDPNHTSLGRLGLIIMKERVDNIGGVMEIISHEGQGTLIKVVWVVAADEGQSS